MLWKTHLAGGVIAGALIGPNPAGIAVAGISALLPDIDTPSSVIGERLLPVSAVLKATVGHRGIFHSLILAGSIYWLSLKFIPAYAIYILAGYLSHLILDCLNPEGAPLLWPLKIRFSLPLVTTGSIIEKGLMIPLFVMAAYFTFKGVSL